MVGQFKKAYLHRPIKILHLSHPREFKNVLQNIHVIPVRIIVPWLYKKIAKAEKDKVSLKKSNATLRKRVHRMKKLNQIDQLNNVLTPRKSVSYLRQNGHSPSHTSKDLIQFLLFKKFVFFDTQR